MACAAPTSRGTSGLEMGVRPTGARHVRRSRGRPFDSEVLSMADFPQRQDGDPEWDLERMNDVLAAWAARSAIDSAALIDRFEAMGYEVRGKSEDEIAAVLHRPPTRPAQGSATA
jgi:hypothetical protein